MGDIADMILDGILDEWTGEHIGPGVGYPRSLDPEHYSNQRYVSTNKSNPIAGINGWLNQQWLTRRPEHQDKNQANMIIINRFNEEVLQSELRKYKKVCTNISANHWKHFMDWVKQEYK